MSEIHKNTFENINLPDQHKIQELKLRDALALGEESAKKHGWIDFDDAVKILEKGQKESFHVTT